MKRVWMGLILSASFILLERGEAAEVKVPVLTMDPDARAAALGGAYVAVAQGATALDWNPAGLKGEGKKTVLFSHAAYAESIQFSAAALALPLSDAWTLGLGGRHFSAGDIPKTDGTGNSLGTFTPSDTALTVGVAHTGKNSSFGLSVKYIQSTLDNTATGLALFLGVRAQFMKTQWGASAGPWGTELDYDGKKASLAQELRGGVAVPLGSRLSASGDVFYSLADETTDFGAGLEARLVQSSSFGLALRGGYNSRTKDFSNGSGLSAGLGLSFSALSLDYAFTALGDLDAAQRVTLSMSF